MSDATPPVYGPDTRPWRVAPDGMTIVVQVGPAPTWDDYLIGRMVTPELAAAVVEAHNAYVAGGGEPDDAEGPLSG